MAEDQAKSGPTYAMVKRKKRQDDMEGSLPPLSGYYEGSIDIRRSAKAELEIKIDIDRIRKFSSVLQIISGSIIKPGGRLLSLGDNTALYFQSVGKIKVNKNVPGAVNNDREISCSIEVTRCDGEQFNGTMIILLRLPQDDGQWGGNCTFIVGNEKVTFEGITRKSSFFRKCAIDIDYVNDVVWPEITLGNYFGTEEEMKNRKLDPKIVFEDAGIELMYDEEDNDKIEDPTPYTAWTKDDMYDVMMANFDSADDDIETIWCMIASKPPDERFMGFSFDRKGRRGFGIFTGHKSFKGLLEPDSESHIYATRRFLHYFVHECGHTLGLVHPFEIGKPNELTWMNYSWKYDQINGPGQFYENHDYSFTKSELTVLRHSPSKAFEAAKQQSVQTTRYGVVKSIPASSYEDEIEEDNIDEEETYKLSLRITIRPEPYHVKEIIELEIRLKNEGDLATMVDRDLDVESRNVIAYVTCPDGSVEKLEAFVRPLSFPSQVKPLILYPNGDPEGADRYSQLIKIGEGRDGSVFSHPGKYSIKAVYIGEPTSVASNTLEIDIIQQSTDALSDDDINTAWMLGNTSGDRFHGAAAEWKRMTQLPVEQKKLVVSKLISVVDSLTKKEVRHASVTTDKGKKRKRKAVQVGAQTLTYEDFLAGTKDLVDYYKKQGKKSENMNYKEVVFARGRLMKLHQNQEADIEFNQLLADLIVRGLKYPSIKSISDEWNGLGLPATPSTDRNTPASLQKRVDEILDWYPKKLIHGKKELSGIGLGTILNNFDDDHVKATAKISKLIFNKLDETNDLNDVLDFADNLQKGFQVNHRVLQWAVEIFIIHSKLAKESGILYPLPPDKEASTGQQAAMVVTQRTGIPRESWMNYWRCDADLNFHHRHWHSVYVVGRQIASARDWFGNRWLENPRGISRPELLRQGELFAYMHSQMLARYDAERLSWGMGRVQAFQYQSTTFVGFDAGFEFNSSGQNANVLPRPANAPWPQSQRQRFEVWEGEYNYAVRQGFLPPVRILGEIKDVELDFNLAGHVLEASSSTWGSSIGNIHNAGHGVFGTNQIRGGSYMLSTATAMRDPIFYRWHKRIDDLWHRWNDTVLTDLSDGPGIEIRPSDILMKRSSEPLDNFASFASDSLSSDEMQTYLGVPSKRWEWDNKKSHVPFYYHIRFRRIQSGRLNLTFRIFICPASHVRDRKMWIEMDKFVYSLEENQNSAVIVRPDRHSSVIKRIPGEMEGNIEQNFTQTVPGFCECGWPYNMLLPRGTVGGEEWRLCVFVSNNDIDNIRVKSSCGSLSFCGARGEAYPDRRAMGYPFTTEVSVDGVEMSVNEAMERLPNAALSSFVIRNNVSAPPPSSWVDMWSPWLQLNQQDGNDPSINSDVTAFRPSRLVAVMRILIDDRAMQLSNDGGQVRVRFHSRGEGNGGYRIARANIAIRNGNTPNTVEGTSVPITVSGQTSFTVPEEGVISDEIDFRSRRRDVFVTFALESPGSYLAGSSNEMTSTWRIHTTDLSIVNRSNWTTVEGVRLSPSIYCVGGVMIAVPS